MDAMGTDRTTDRTVDHERAAHLLGDASGRVVRTVDGFHGDDWTAPSLLPGWTRAHVVAHSANSGTAIQLQLETAFADRVHQLLAVSGGRARLDRFSGLFKC